MEEHIVVLGQSPFSLSIACDFLLGGVHVTVFDATASHAGHKRMDVYENSSKCSFNISITPSIEIFSTATILIANFGGHYDEKLLNSIAPLFKPGLLFIVFPGYFLSHRIQNHLRKLQVNHCILCEITSAPCVCELTDPETMQVFKRKNRLKIATLPSSNINQAIERLHPFLPMLYGAKNVIETSLENINSILHPLPILLNLPTVAHDPKQFRHYVDGIDNHVSKLMHLMDEERLRVGLAWDILLDPVIEHLKVFYGTNEAGTIVDYIGTPECPYDDIKGYGLDSRYITLDVPHLIVPTIRLARERNIPTPIFDACFNLAKPFLPYPVDLDSLDDVN